MRNNLRNILIPMAMKKPSLYFVAIVSGILSLITILLVLSIFDIKSGLEDIVLPCMVVFYLFIYSLLVDSIMYIREEYRMRKTFPMLIIGYSNLVGLFIEGKLEWVIDTDEVIIRPPTNEESGQFFNKDVSIISCYSDNKKIIDYAVVGVKEYEGYRLVRDETREEEDVIRPIYNEDFFDYSEDNKG